MKTDLTVSDFDYPLPPALIAQEPARRREDARLMLVSRRGDREPVDAAFGVLPSLLSGDELIIYNDTRVVPARLHVVKATGGKVELLVLETTAGRQEAVALARSSKAMRVGMQLVAGAHRIDVTDVLGGGKVGLSLVDGTWGELLAAHGEVPLPPYIERAAGPRPTDADRYQTVFAREPGAVAAPTAGLHFTEPLLDAIRAKGCGVAAVTLHVGPGTFRPVRVDRIADHTMHAERYSVPDATAQAVASARAEGRPVLAVGTTSVRALEAAATGDGAVQPGAGRTDIFIAPGYRFRVVDQLLTNFHLPRSTLLMLVSAFAGRDNVMHAYAEAVARGYRFYSYGDGMLLR